MLHTEWYGRQGTISIDLNQIHEPDLIISDQLIPAPQKAQIRKISL